MLRAIPAERIFTVQFNDGPRQRVDPDYYTDCTRYRDVPGEGEFDLVGFLGLLDEMGVRLPLSVEVISADLLQRPAGEVAAGWLTPRVRSWRRRPRGVRWTAGCVRPPGAS